MKKLFLTLTLLLFHIFIASAEEVKVPITIDKGNTSSGNKDWNRAPARSIVDIYYDTDTHAITVIGRECIEAEIFLYDNSGMLVDYSSEINVVFTVITPGDYTISIVSEDWSGVGIITVEN
ncbi:MAG: hypothetical protein HDS52_02025 [Barnesiella sp.]|nr:hypothetical protein [Barnesiella sp.]